MIHELHFDDERIRVRYNDVLRTATLTHLDDDRVAGQTIQISVHRSDGERSAPTPWSITPVVNSAGQLIRIVVDDSNGHKVMVLLTSDRAVLDATMRMVEVANASPIRVQLRQVTTH